MNWKKVLLVTLALLLVLGLVACGGDKDEAADTSEAPAAAEGLKIAIVTSPSGVDDGSFNQNNYEGIQAFIAAHPGATVTDVRETDPDKAIPAVEAIVADYDVIVTPGFQFAGITEIAQANPEKYFILVDAFPANPEDPFGDPVEVENIYAMQFAEQESGFFAGIAAAMETKSGKVAFIGGMAYPAVVNYHLGFECGVNYANKHLGAKAELVNIKSYAGEDVFGNNVGGNYVGAFDDEATGKKVGEDLLAKGADILFVAAGGSGNGAFTAAKEAEGAFVIGCDTDQYDLGADGDRNVVLTSVLKVMDINVERQLNAIEGGSFKGGNYTLKADTDSTGYVSEPGRQQLSDAVLDALAAAFGEVKSGAIVPVSNVGMAFNGESVTDFPGL